MKAFFTVALTLLLARGAFAEDMSLETCQQAIKSYMSKTVGMHKNLHALDDLLTSSVHFYNDQNALTGLTAQINQLLPRGNASNGQVAAVISRMQSESGAICKANNEKLNEIWERKKNNMRTDRWAIEMELESIAKGGNLGDDCASGHLYACYSIDFAAIETLPSILASEMKATYQNFQE